MITFLLASSLVMGAIWCVVLLFICFVCVHLVKFAKIGFDVTQKATKQQTTTQTNKQNIPDGKTPSGQKPIYYFVKQKKRNGQTVYKRSKRFRYK